MITLKVLTVVAFFAVNGFFFRGAIGGDFDNFLKAIVPAAVVDIVFIIGGAALFIFF